MKAVLVLLCCFAIINAQLTTTQIAGNWIDDGTNSGISSSCCVPTATSTVPVVFAQGSSTSTVTTTGTWSSTPTVCTTLNLKGVAINSASQTLTSSAAANNFPILFTYTYALGTTAAPATLAVTSDASTTASPNTNGGITITYLSGSTVCTQTLTAAAASGFTGKTSSTWGTSTAPIQWYLTAAPTPSGSCCQMTLASTASSDNTKNLQMSISGTTVTLTWTWDTTNTATQCKAAGLSGTATTTGTWTAVSTTSGQIPVLAAITTTPSSVNALTSASAGTWTYYLQGTQCAFNLKKNTSSASYVGLSFAGLLLFFVAHL